MSQELLFRCASVLIFGTTLVGCFSRGPKIVPVSGKLTRNGQPVANLEVYFMPTQGRPSVGTSDPMGQFKLRFTREQEGASVGTHTVFVTFNPPDQSEYASPSDLNEILAKYGSKDVSPLKIEIAQAVKDLEIKLD